MLNSKYNQIIFYVLITTFSVFFTFYFYKQATVSGYVVEEIKVKSSPSSKVISEKLKINTELFEKDKFKKLRDVGVPTPKFNTGKRNPFEQS